VFGHAPNYIVSPKKRFNIKFKKKPSGPEKRRMKTKSSIKPYCSSMIITSVLTGKTANKSFEPSNGGNGIRLKKAKITFQKIIKIEISKKIDPIDPDINAETADQLLKLLIIAILTDAGIAIVLAQKAKISAIKIFEPGPPSATRAGPHF